MFPTISRRSPITRDDPRLESSPILIVCRAKSFIRLLASHNHALDLRWCTGSGIRMLVSGQLTFGTRLPV